MRVRQRQSKVDGEMLTEPSPDRDIPHCNDHGLMWFRSEEDGVLPSDNCRIYECPTCGERAEVNDD